MPKPARHIVAECNNDCLWTRTKHQDRSIRIETEKARAGRDKEPIEFRHE